MNKENLVLNQLVNNQRKKLEGSLWSNEPNKEKYAFELSPNVKFFNKEQEDELRKISGLIYAHGGLLHGSIKMYAALKESEKLKGSPVGGMIWRALSYGISKHELDIQALFNQLPLFARCDLMMQSGHGPKSFFQIAEVEGDKTHGMGYYDGFILPNAMEIIGQIPGTTFSDAVLKSVGNEEVILLVGDSEKFYLAEMKMLLEPAAKQAGLKLTVTDEESLKVAPGQTYPLEVGNIRSKWLISLPTLNAKGLYHLYKNGAINCLIPPNRFLCNKALLGLISNGLNDPELDRWLQEYFDWATILALRKFIPTTVLVTKANKNEIVNLIENNGDAWVIKKTVSSGAKGVSLDHDNGSRQTMVSDMMKAPNGYIVQQKVEQQPCGFWHTEFGSLIHSLMYTRVELFSQYGDGGILTVGITARKSKAVHVQKDAIQIPVRFTSNN